MVNALISNKRFSFLCSESSSMTNSNIYILCSISKFLLIFNYEEMIQEYQKPFREEKNVRYVMESMLLELHRQNTICVCLY